MHGLEVGVEGAFLVENLRAVCADEVLDLAVDAVDVTAEVGRPSEGLVAAGFGTRVTIRDAFGHVVVVLEIESGPAQEKEGEGVLS